ncbi:MAG: hypothetical protein JKX99_06170 [Robiginitomaculum sp.]|nr:hypothetical protein [Robiginitomaculum sp.]
MEHAIQDENFDQNDHPKVAPPILSLDHFDFESKVFKVEGIWFQRNSLTGEADFYVPLGTIQACIPVSKILAKFAIDPDGNDAKLLLRVERALLHVPTIRPGDAIPSELIDGTASWKYEICHKLIAEGRLAWHVLQWAKITDAETPSPSELISFSQSPQMQTHGKDAHQALADKLELANLDELYERIAELANELAYVEALKEHFVSIFQLQRQFSKAAHACKNEKVAADEFSRILALSQAPLQWVRQQFVDLFDDYNHIEPVLSDIKAAVIVIRKFRDQLHLESRKWAPIVKDWNAEKNPEQNVHIRRRIYHFLASQWSFENQWAV